MWGLRAESPAQSSDHMGWDARHPLRLRNRQHPGMAQDCRTLGTEQYLPEDRVPLWWC